MWLLGIGAASAIAGAGKNGAPPLPFPNEDGVLGGVIGLLPSSGEGTTAYSNFLSVLEANNGSCFVVALHMRCCLSNPLHRI